MKTFKTPKNKKTVPSLTSTIAQQIYGYFSQGLKPSDCFKQYGIPLKHARRVRREVEKLEREVDSKMSGTYVTVPEIKNEQGEITQAAEYFVVTDKVSVSDSLTSELLNTSLWLNDYIKWDSGNYKADRTWPQFKNLYSE